MKTAILLTALLSALLVSSCLENPFAPVTKEGTIIAYIHWGAQPIAGKQVVLLPDGVSKFTDSTGRASFSARPGSSVIRAYGINRGGPVYISVDYNVYVRGGDTTVVDIIDCIPCL
jgi:hypothetical protein